MIDELYPNYTDYYFGKNFYYMGIKNVGLSSLFIVFVLAFWFFADQRLPDLIRNHLTFLGRNLTTFYILSWVYIGSTIHLLAYWQYQLSAWENVAMMLLQLILCYASTQWLKRAPTHSGSTS